MKQMCETDIKIKKPLFLVIEGIDGAGKTTIQQNLYNLFVGLGHDVLNLREPTSSSHGKQIRKLLSESKMPDINHLLDLFIADRHEDVQNNILPALQTEKIIIMDRYFYSNAAYQGAGDILYKQILNMNLEKNFPIPDRVYFIDILPEVAIDRIEKRNLLNGEKSELFEKSDFLKKVRNNFILMANEYDLFLIIDGSLSPDQIVEAIYNDIIEKYCKKC